MPQTNQNDNHNGLTREDGPIEQLQNSAESGRGRRRGLQLRSSRRWSFRFLEAMRLDRRSFLMISYEEFIFYFDRLEAPSRPELKVVNGTEVTDREPLLSTGAQFTAGDGGQNTTLQVDQDLQLERLINTQLQSLNRDNPSPLPDDLRDYICPLTLCVFNQPVLASDGQRYELQALKDLFENNAQYCLDRDQWIVQSPMNRSELDWEVRFDTEMHNWINDAIRRENRRLQSQFASNNSAHDYGENRLFSCKGSRKRGRGEDNPGGHKEIDGGNIKRARV